MINEHHVVSTKETEIEKIRFEFESRGFYLYNNFIKNESVSYFRNLVDKSYFENESWTDQQKRSSDIHKNLFFKLAKDIEDHPLMKTLIGYTHRLIESYAVRRASGLLDLHGGYSEFLQQDDARDISAGSFVKHGQLYTLRMKVIIYLDDALTPDEGQFIYIEGSHKSEFSFHRAFPHGRETAGGMLRSLEIQAGDALWLNEALLHGASEKKSEGDRRFLAFQFGPTFMADWRDIEGASSEAGYICAEAERV